MLTAIRIRNLRCLLDTKDVQLRPINILLGRNSSGKSTFARIFPLHRQTAEDPHATGPAWYGRFVDFGSYVDAVSADPKAASISFDYTFAFKSLLPRLEFGRQPSISATVSVTWAPGATSDAVFPEQTSVRIAQHLIEFRTLPNGDVSRLTVDGTELDIKSAFLHTAPQSALIPNYFEAQSNDPASRDPTNRALLSNHLLEKLRPLTNNPQKAVEALRVLRPGHIDDATVHKTLRISPRARRHDAHIHQVRLVLLAQHAVGVLREARDSLTDLSHGVTYLSPFRATGERYYRPRSDNPLEVEPDGRNLSVFLKSLRTEELDAFHSFARQTVGVETIAIANGAHLEIQVREPHDRIYRNLTDVGFGYSQVLPLLAQLWSAARSSRPRFARHSRQTLVTIEQPELHLHPAAQAKIADVLAAYGSMMAEQDRSSTIFVETHSEALVNRIGQLIARGTLGSHAVQVLVFSRSPKTGASDIAVSEFDPSGALANWPYGFFLPDDDS